MKSPPPMANEGLCGGAPPPPPPTPQPHLSPAQLYLLPALVLAGPSAGVLSLPWGLSLLSLPPLLQVSDVPCTADLPRPQLK